jgi:hypothetical protein
MTNGFRMSFSADEHFAVFRGGQEQCGLRQRFEHRGDVRITEARQKTDLADKTSRWQPI